MTECTVLSQPDLVFVIIKSVPAVPYSVNGKSGCHVREERERERETDRDRDRQTDRQTEEKRRENKVILYFTRIKI